MSLAINDSYSKWISEEVGFPGGCVQRFALDFDFVDDFASVLVRLVILAGYLIQKIFLLTGLVQMLPLTH